MVGMMPDDVFALVVAAGAIAYAWPIAMELFVSWYSGTDHAVKLSWTAYICFVLSVSVAATAIASVF